MIHTPKEEIAPKRAPKSRSKIKALRNMVVWSVMALIMSSCNPFDAKGEFVKNGDTTSVENIPNPRAGDFLTNIRDVVNRTRTGWSTPEIQSFDNLYKYTEDNVRWIGEDIRVQVQRTTNMTIDTRISPANSAPYMNYSITAQKKWNNNRHIFISWSWNFLLSWMPMAGQIEILNYKWENITYIRHQNGIYQQIPDGWFLDAINWAIPSL